MGVESAQNYAKELLDEALSLHARAGLEHNLLAELAVLAVQREF